jgi:hypothetical protein
MTTQTKTKRTKKSFLFILLLAIGGAVSLPACDLGSQANLFQGWGH